MSEQTYNYVNRRPATMRCSCAAPFCNCIDAAEDAPADVFVCMCGTHCSTVTVTSTKAIAGDHALWLAAADPEHSQSSGRDFHLRHRGHRLPVVQLRYEVRLRDRDPIAREERRLRAKKNHVATHTP
jgi:hypothetical protein